MERCHTFCLSLYCIVLCVLLCIISVDTLLTSLALCAQLKLLYVRKVNPNRVHLGTELTVDAQGEAQVSGYDRFFYAYNHFAHFLHCSDLL